MNTDITKIVYTMNNMIQNDYIRILEDKNYSFIEGQILLVLYTEGKCNQEYISNKIGVKKSYTSQVIKKLVEKKYVEIVKGKDKRNNQLNITEDGIEVALEFDGIVSEYNKNILDGISEHYLFNTDMSSKIIVANIYRNRKNK